ncbi:hypothetical protein [Actinophytocola sp. KF-1]
MNDRLYVDVEALTRGGINLAQWSALANRIGGRLQGAAATYRNAGGTGEMGEQFDTNYKPGEQKALEFLVMLMKVVGSYSEKTFEAAKVFEESNTEADAATPRQ